MSVGHVSTNGSINCILFFINGITEKSSELAVNSKSFNFLDKMKIYLLYKTKELILPLHKSRVRPHLEHAVQFWSPHLRQDIDKIEKIQRRATKMIPEIRNHSFHLQIQDLDLVSLVQRRLRGQLIEVFKYLYRFTAAIARGLFDYDLNARTRNKGAELIVNHLNISVAEHFYTIKITTTWNALPNEIVTSRTVNSFKNSLD